MSDTKVESKEQSDLQKLQSKLNSLRNSLDSFENTIGSLQSNLFKEEREELGESPKSEMPTNRITELIDIVESCSLTQDRISSKFNRINGILE